MSHQRKRQSSPDSDASSPTAVRRRSNSIAAVAAAAAAPTSSATYKGRVGRLTKPFHPSSVGDIRSLLLSFLEERTPIYKDGADLIGGRIRGTIVTYSCDESAAGLRAACSIIGKRSTHDVKGADGRWTIMIELMTFTKAFECTEAEPAEGMTRAQYPDGELKAFVPGRSRWVRIRHLPPSIFREEPLCKAWISLFDPQEILISQHGFVTVLARSVADADAIGRIFNGWPCLGTYLTAESVNYN